MISNSKDQVTREAYDRSLPVPRVWAATMAYDRWCFLNQENGWGGPGLPAPRPSRADVERMLG